MFSKQTTNPEAINQAKFLLQSLLAKQHLSAKQSEEMLCLMISGDLPPQFLLMMAKGL